ncbi:MAG: mechanosensitive ion channel family protein [Enhygromyxa sp.]
MIAASSLAKTTWLADLLAKDPDDIAVIALRAALILVIGLALGRLLGGLAGRMAARRGSAQGQMLTRRFVFYGVVGVALFMALDTLGVEIGVLLGAAGILTVALGFASQTSASNLISGLFLLGERPFSVGDVIQVSGRTGAVISVDLLSVKLRTFDNLFVRVPNETLIKSEIVNLSRNPIRRIEIELRLAYGEDLDRVRQVLREIAEDDPSVLEEPEPVVWVDRLGDSAIHLRFLVWAPNRQDFFAVRSQVFEAVARALHEHRIAVGYPRVDVEGGDPKTKPAAAESVARPPAPR